MSFLALVPGAITDIAVAKILDNGHTKILVLYCIHTPLIVSSLHCTLNSSSSRVMSPSMHFFRILYPNGKKRNTITETSSIRPSVTGLYLLNC